MAVAANQVTVWALFVAVIGAQVVVLIIANDARAPGDVTLFHVDAQRATTDVGD
jgi:hypothetical protein